MLNALFTTQLSNLFEAQLVSFFLVDKVLREKHAKTLDIMQSRVSNLGKRTREGGVALR